MKTKIFKIIIMLTISLLLSAGVTRAHDTKRKKNESHGKTYSYYRDHKGSAHHPGWHKKHYKSRRHSHRPHNHYHRHYYHRSNGHHPSWHRDHYKSYRHRHRHKHRYHKHYDHYELHGQHHYDKHNPHHVGFIFGMSFQDPYMAVTIGGKRN